MPRDSGLPNNSPAKDWARVAAELAAEFAPHAVERERRNEPPVDELARIREAGIVNLLIPEKFGGEGGNWRQAVRVVVELSKADPNIGVLLAYHFHNFVPPFLDFDGDAEAVQRKSAANRWLWGHVTHPYIHTLFAEPQPDGGLIVRGSKPMNTGAPTADVTTVLAESTDRKEYVYAYVPTNRKGLEFEDVWDHLGLRRSKTSKMIFNDVVVAPDEVLPRSHRERFIGFQPFYAASGALAFGSVYLGAALGALEQAKRFTLNHSRPRPGPGVGSAVSQDPYVLADYGDFWIKTQAALAYLDEVAGEFDTVFADRRNLTDDALSRLNAHSNAFRLYAGKIGIEIGSRIYDVTGASATANKYGFDRYWRDVRIHSLHVHPPAYGHRELGDYFINGAPQLGAPFYHD